MKRNKLLVMKTQSKSKCSRKVKKAIKIFLSKHTHAAWQYLQEVVD